MSGVVLPRELIFDDISTPVVISLSGFRSG